MPRKKATNAKETATVAAGTRKRTARSLQKNPTATRQKRATRSSRTVVPIETEDHGTQTDDDDESGVPHAATTTRGTNPPTPVLPSRGSPLRLSGITTVRSARGSASPAETRVFHPLKSASASPRGSPLKRRAVRRLTRGAVDMPPASPSTTSSLRRVTAPTASPTPLPRTATASSAGSVVSDADSPSTTSSKKQRAKRSGTTKGATSGKRNATKRTRPTRRQTIATTSTKANAPTPTTAASLTKESSVDADPTAEGEGIADTDSRSESGADTAGVRAELYAACNSIDAMFDVFTARIDAIHTHAFSSVQ